MIEPSEIEVLIVEDDQFNVRLLSDVCTAAGYSFRIAMDGIEALERISERVPDLVLLDIMIPRLSGFGVLSQLREAEQTRQLPVIVVSAIQDDQTRARGIEMGADDYVRKPFKISELRQRMLSALEMAAFKRKLGIG